MNKPKKERREGQLKICVAVHLGYPSIELATELMSRAALIRDVTTKQGMRCDIHCTLSHPTIHRWLTSTYPEVTTYYLENRGVDCLAFLYVLRQIQRTHFLVFKIHTKSDPVFRRLLFQNFLLTRDDVFKSVMLAVKNPQLGILFSQGYAVEPCFYQRLTKLLLEWKWCDYFADAEPLLEKARFSGGAFFLARVRPLWRAFEAVDWNSEMRAAPFGKAYSSYESRLHMMERLWGIPFVLTPRRWYYLNFSHYHYPLVDPLVLPDPEYAEDSEIKKKPC